MNEVKINELYESRIVKTMQIEHPSKRDIRTLLILLRMIIRIDLANKNKAWADCRYIMRQKNTLKRIGAEAPFLDQLIKKHRAISQKMDKIAATSGHSLQILLDMWEEAGASRKDLYDLCGIRKLKEDKQNAIDENPEDSLFKLVFVYNLDYPNNGKDFIEDDVDAPFTHAAKEYMLDVMLNTEKGRKASRDAMTAVFPGIMEHTMIVRENEFGEKCLYDSEGNLVSTLEPEEGGGHE